MDLDFTSEQGMLRDSVAKFLANECPFDKVRELEESDAGYSPELWQQVAELGWLGLPFPEEAGGFGGGFLDLVIIQEEIGKALLPSPYFSTVVQCGYVLLEGASAEQQEALLTQVAEGSLIMALAQYEIEGSYLESGIQLAASADGDGYTLKGTKLFVMDANIADKLIVAARVEGAGVTLFLVDAKDPGVAVTKMPTVGMDNNCEVILKDVRVSKEDVIGAPGEGWAILEKMNEKAAVAEAAEMLGGCKFCIGTTVAYAKEREQYGRPIGGNQVLQHYMANMLLAHDTASSYLYRVASMIEGGEDVAVESSVIKAAANENFKFISERAVQIHGGIGTSREHDIGLFYRRAKSHEFRSGSTDFHHDRIADVLAAGKQAKVV